MTAPRVFTLAIDGGRIACFDADSIEQAHEHVEGITGDLRRFASNGAPIWDGVSALVVGPAAPAEAAQWTTSYELAKRVNGDFADPDAFPLCTVFLVQCTTHQGVELCSGEATRQ